MTVHAFRMQLRPGAETEYRRRHDEIWPELSSLLHAAGIREYRIFLDPETSALFAVLTLLPENKRETLPAEPIMRCWWDHMADLMEVDETNRPREWSLTEVFYQP